MMFVEIVAVVFGRCLNIFGNVNRRWMMSWSNFFYNCVEAVVIIRCIFHDSYTTVWLVNTVRAVYNITITNFVLGFYVTGMGIVYTVVEGVLWMRLKQKIVGNQ